MGALPGIITRLVGWAVSVFYEVERTGPALPAGPVLVVANHPNALMDPLVIFRTAGRATRPLAKAPLFEQALVGTVLKGLGGLPVYRRQDDPALVKLNDRTFDAAISALHEGGAVQIYPEGQSHSLPSMTPLRTGAARIALLAEERAGWTLGLHIQPVGLTYVRKDRFRGRVVAAFGEPIRIADLRERHEAAPRAVVRELTDLLADRLHALTLGFSRDEDRALVEVAERLYQREHGLARPRERESLADRLPRLQRFARGIEWLASEDPARLEKLRHSVTRYMHMLVFFGANEGDVPTRYRVGSVVLHALRQVTLLAVVMPVAMVGMVFWWLPFEVTGRIAARFRPALDQVATYKIGVGIVAFPLWLTLAVTASWLAAGWVMALIVGLAMPVAGLAAITWRELGAATLEDVRVFRRTRGRGRVLARLAEQRAALVAEFDDIGERWHDPGPPDGGPGETGPETPHGVTTD